MRVKLCCVSGYAGMLRGGARCGPETETAEPEGSAVLSGGSESATSPDAGVRRQDRL